MSEIKLPSGPRLLLEIDLKPVQGTRFQPTGFPDIGPGVFLGPDGSENCLVESVQSVANRLESVCWDDSEKKLVEPLQGLPYIKVVDSADKFLTASVLEAHRLNSVYIVRSKFFEDLKKEIGSDGNESATRKNLIPALAKYDVSCLLHGVFLEKMAGVLRIPRALSGFIEASRVSRVNTGGVKFDRVQPTKDEEGGKTASEGFGNLPFHRTEFVADKITAYFNLDLAQIRAYGLGNEMEDLLFALALFKVHQFLATGLRLRTACDLVKIGELKATSPSGLSIPNLEAIVKKLPDLITSVKIFPKSPVTEVKFDQTIKKGKKGKKDENSEVTP